MDIANNQLNRGATGYAQRGVMKSTPILYSRPMVIAHKEGRKTQTRRLRGLEKLNLSPDYYSYGGQFGNGDHGFDMGNGDKGITVKSPYGGEGDQLWIRETFLIDSVGNVRYRATETAMQDGNWIWRPSIYMPRWACRFAARIISVRPERLHDMTESDAQAEGVDGSYTNLGNGDFDVWMPTEEFRTLWDSLNGDRHPWSSNPWVWRIEYERNRV